jgi:hypothetical protein
VAPEQAGASVRAAVTRRVQDLHAQASAAYDRLRQLERQRGGVNVDIAPVRQALQPIYDRLRREAELTPLQGGKAKALVALDRLMTGHRTGSVPLSVADAALSDLKALARGADLPELRTQGQGIAARAVQELSTRVELTARQAGADIAGALHEGRMATRGKYAAADVLDQLSTEPVQVFSQVTWQRDAGIGRLRDLAKQAPHEMALIGRAYLDDLFSSATAEGGFARAQALHTKWSNLGPETKKLLFKSPDYIKDLDNFFLLAKRIAHNPNPSGSGHTILNLSHLGAVWTDPATGALVTASTAAIGKLLHSPRFVKLLTRGLTVPLRNRAAAATITSELSNALKELGETVPAFAPIPAHGRSEVNRGR